MARQNRRILGFGELGRRLAVAFVGVALAAIAVNSVVSAETLDSDIRRVAGQPVAKAVALSSAAAYQGIGWRRTDLIPVFELAAGAGAGVQLRDATGRVVARSPGFARLPATQEHRLPVIKGRRRVGQVLVRFGSRGLGGLASTLEARRWRSRIIAAVIAALIALIVSVIVARLVTGPLEVMLTALRARGAGDRNVRIKKVRGVGVQRELLEGFNKSTDALDERDRLQRNLVADVAHEVRTPVAILQAGHEAILDGVSEPTPENLGSLRDEVLRLARMIDDLQRLSAAEAAALQLDLAPCDLGVIAAEAADSLSDSFRAAEIDLVRRLSAVPVRCDYDRIREVVTNLLANALKFTPAGGGVVLETEQDEGYHLARLRVSDTGKGISAQELPRVTERFFRSNSSAEMAAGSGIGLTIVEELVRAHHGELEISSAVGAGTQVTVTLPVSG